MYSLCAIYYDMPVSKNSVAEKGFVNFTWACSREALCGVFLSAHFLNFYCPFFPRISRPELGNEIAHGFSFRGDPCTAGRG